MLTIHQEEIYWSWQGTRTSSHYGCFVGSTCDNTAYWKYVCRNSSHDDVIKWKHFPRYWPFVRGIHRSPVNSPHKDQWRGALMFSLICAWTTGWVNNREAGDLSHHRAHYDVTVMRIAIIEYRRIILNNFIVNRTHGKKHQRYLNQNIKAFCHENIFENVICKSSAIWSFLILLRRKALRFL